MLQDHYTFLYIALLQDDYTFLYVALKDRLKLLHLSIDAGVEGEEGGIKGGLRWEVDDREGHHSSTRSSHQVSAVSAPERAGLRDQHHPQQQQQLFSEEEEYDVRAVRSSDALLSVTMDMEHSPQQLVAQQPVARQPAARQPATRYYGYQEQQSTAQQRLAQQLAAHQPATQQPTT